MASSWSVHELTMYFSAITACEREDDALVTAAELVVEAFDAEVVAVTDGARVLSSVGFPSDLETDGLLSRLTEQAPATAELPAVGSCHLMVTRTTSNATESLLVGRLDDPFTAEERHLLQGKAQVLALALRAIRTLANERRLRAEQQAEAEERLRLLAEVRAREHLLERLLEIQAAVSRREPLDEVLRTVASGAADLLTDGGIVAVVRRDARADGDGEIASVSGRISSSLERQVRSAAAACLDRRQVERRTAPGQALVAVPVGLDSGVEGSLVAVLPDEAVTGAENEVLAAFAQQVETALLDVHTLAAVDAARHDSLTGLPSRALFLDRLRTALDRDRAGLALLFIDLDGFKQVNDSLGHAAGDELLRLVADRLRAALRDDDVPARLGGDEFAVLVTRGGSEGGVTVAQRVIAAVGSPFVVEEREVSVGASIGVVQAGDHVTHDAELLVEDADVAMYRAKATGGGTTVVFDHSMRDDAREQLDLHSHLRRALEQGDIHLHYQPVFRVADGGLAGVEALARLDHPERGDVPPATFLPIAERSGLVHDLGRLVLRRALEDVRRWRRDLPDLVLGVNVSGLELRDGYAEAVTAALADAGQAADGLLLELTETTLVTGESDVVDTLERLRARGVRVAVDDFGTGWSSLAYLRRLPVDVLKVDRAFVDGLTVEPDDRAVVRTVIELARMLGLDTVAEGVEDLGQLTVLRELGCDLAQGFALAGPMPAADVDAIVAAHRVDLPASA